MIVTNTDKLYCYCVTYHNNDLSHIKSYEGIIVRSTYSEAVQYIEEMFQEYNIISIEVHRTYLVFNKELVNLILNS